jgi:hypothetical protein
LKVRSHSFAHSKERANIARKNREDPKRGPQNGMGAHLPLGWWGGKNQSN